jgi:hypothetical protein
MPTITKTFFQCNEYEDLLAVRKDINIKHALGGVSSILEALTADFTDTNEFSTVLAIKETFENNKKTHNLLVNTISSLDMFAMNLINKGKDCRWSAFYLVEMSVAILTACLK